MTSIPRKGPANRNRWLLTVTGWVTSMSLAAAPSAGGGGSGSRTPKWSRKRNATRLAVSTVSRFQCWPHSTRSAARGLPASEERGVVPHPRPRHVARVAHDVGGETERAREVAALAGRAAEGEGGRGVLHRVQVEQVVDAVEGWPKLPRAPELHAVAPAPEHLARPQPVEVLVHVAAEDRMPGVEAFVGVDVP